MRNTSKTLVWCAVLAAALTLPAAGQVEIDSATIGGLEARAIGPAKMSGRIAALDAVAEDPLTIYVGAASGGVWKSKDGGVLWKPVFEEHIQSIGAVTIDPKDPKTVWVGTGESWTRNSVSVGDGVYKTTDAGDNWQRVGLENTERIARIRVHPTDGKTVWVCATGHLWDSHEDRGVYKTTDGGKTWKKTLYVDAGTGCSDLDVDPQDPQIVYAGMWTFRRYPWSFNSGGKGSGLYKSTDGGETWREIKTGLPAGIKGRIAVAVAPSRPSVVYALVESEATAIYRSDDVGESFREMNSSANIQTRPFYFAHVVVDPGDFNRVYKPGLSLTVSTDGGKTFTSQIGGGGSVHGDHHALWINPKNPHEMILGTDGGIYISFDRAGAWRFVKALPLSQFYQVSVDMDWPYNVYGGLQDNGSWMGPSRGVAGIQNGDWRNVGGGDGFHVYRDPANPDFVYAESQGGNIFRLQLSTSEARDIKPLPGTGEPEYRFNWNTPIHPSPNEPGTIYLCGQFLFRSRDHGASWDKISPDLTTDDKSKQQQLDSGGLNVDNSTAENHTTIYTISESPKDGKVIWVGTDDGNLQVTRDGGATWTNVVGNAPGVPKSTWVSSVDASPHDGATAYATFDGHALGDMKTYVYKTTDYGQTWKALGGKSLDGASFAHAVRQDLQRPDLLFVGTELGLWVSLDDGASFARFTGRLPKVPVRFLAIHPRDGDLVIATHGRGLYILDDLTPLRSLTAKILDADAAILPTRPSPMVLPASAQDFPGDDEFVGFNPDDSATIAYYLKKRHVFGDIKAEVYDAKGEKMATLVAGKRKGINRIAWPMRLPPPRVPAGNSIILQPFSFFGPRVPPGVYTVKLIQGDKTYTGTIELVPEPRSTYSAEDRALQRETAMAFYKMFPRLSYLAESALAIRDQARERAKGLAATDKLKKTLESLAKEAEAFRATLVATRAGGWLSGEEQIREKLGKVYGAINGYEGRPTQAQLDQVKVMDDALTKAAGRYETLEKGPLAAANAELAKRKLDPIKPKTREEWDKESAKQGTLAVTWVPTLLR